MKQIIAAALTAIIATPALAFCPISTEDPSVFMRCMEQEQREQQAEQMQQQMLEQQEEIIRQQREIMDQLDQ